MIILKYTNFENDFGEVLQDTIIPQDIPEDTIHSISPMITNHGVFYRNVTILEDVYGKQYRVVGNWKDWINKVRPRTLNKIGYK